MKFRIDLGFASHVFDTAPTIKTVKGSIKGHDLCLEFFDYGTPMGWGNHTNVIASGGDIRMRIYFDGQRIERGLYEGQVIDHRRPSWLPKALTIKAWNDFIKTLTQP